MDECSHFSFESGRFHISFLMPDIFAAYLIIGAVILTVFWPSLPTFHRALVGSITLFAALSHVTHILLLIGLICIIVGLRLFSRSRSSLFASIRAPLFVLVAIALAGFFGEWLYFQGVRIATGSTAIRPPHLMARLIDDGPGYRFLQKHCEKKIYLVCNYLDRMPIAEDDFLWLDDPKKGVFTPADRITRQKLSQEQTSFVLDVLYFDPIGQLVASLRNATKEFFEIGLDEFNVQHMKLWSYEESVPSEYLEKLKHGRIVTNDKFLKVSERLFFGVYVVSIVGLFLIGFLWRLEKDGKPHDLRHEQYQLMLTMVVTGVVLNAAICGVFGGIFTRYQTRVSWVLLLVLLLALNYTLEMRRRATNSRVD